MSGFPLLSTISYLTETFPTETISYITTGNADACGIFLKFMKKYFLV